MLTVVEVLPPLPDSIPLAGLNRVFENVMSQTGLSAGSLLFLLRLSNLCWSKPILIKTALGCASQQSIMGARTALALLQGAGLVTKLGSREIAFTQKGRAVVTSMAAGGSTA